MKILLGIDDSPCSLTALDYLKQMPWSRHATWRLVSVVQTPAMVYAVPPIAAAEAVEAMETQKVVQREWLSGVDRQLRTAGFESRAMIEEADARTALVEAAREDAADLLVVGSHGRTGLTRVLLGSVAGYAVVHAPCSVLVVKDERPGLGSRPMDIVIGVDDSPYAQDAVQWVRGREWPEGTTVHLLSAVASSGSRFVEANNVALRASRAQARLQQELVSRYERTLKEAGFRCHSAVSEGDPRIELENAARRLNADLLVVGSHGRSGLSKLMLGSVASHLVSHAPCSVLVVKRAPRG